MKYYTIFRYGALKRLKRGSTLCISLLYRCNGNCSYCSLKNGGILMPKCVELRPSEWLSYIESFPVKIREIYLSGGEPGLYNGIEELTNELIDRGYFVTIFTNLSYIINFTKLKKSPRLRFSATFHHHMHADVFIKNYRKISSKYRINVDEIGKKLLPFSKVKTFCTPEDEMSTKMLRVAPDGTIFTNCWERNQYSLK